MGSLLVRPVSSRFSALLILTSFLVFGVFSIRLALRVTSQSRIFASGVHRKFPAPDFNRLASLLPWRTVRSLLLLSLIVLIYRMARPLRIEYDGALYHVTSRGNERKAIFKHDSDRKLFLDMLAQVNKRFHWICHAYCLMDNHVLCGAPYKY